MNTVSPIRDEELLRRCFDIAREHDRMRRRGEICWELLLGLGFASSLRISDIANLRVRDLMGKSRVQIRAKKTGKEANIYVNHEAMRKIQRMIAGRGKDEYVFQSRQRDPVTHEYRPITRQRAWQIMNRIAEKAGVQDKIGCHTLRKTYGYMHYKKYGDVAELQKILNHSAPSVTLRYIGIEQERIEEHQKGMKTWF